MIDLKICCRISIAKDKYILKYHHERYFLCNTWFIKASELHSFKLIEEEIEKEIEDEYGFIIIDDPEKTFSSTVPCHCDLKVCKRRNVCTKKNLIFRCSGEFFSCLMNELRRSQALRELFTKTVETLCLPTSRKVYQHDDSCHKRGSIETIYETVFIIEWPSFLVIDKKWNRILSFQLKQRYELENAMNWLSTLGGACSALGNDDIHFADAAAKLSLEQFKVAVALNDPILISKCKVYWAISLVQKGLLSKARKIIRNEFTLSKSSPANFDFKLQNMCHAVWNMINYKKHLKLCRIKSI